MTGRSGSASGAEPLVAGQTVEVSAGPLGPEARAWCAGARGQAVELAGVLPGERVSAEVTRVRVDGRAYGRLLAVLDPHPERVPPACPRFLDCGGCDLLHAPLPLQHALKRGWVAQHLGLAPERVEVVRASPRTHGYRAFAKLVVGPGGELGSYRPRSHQVVDMSGCVVHAPELEGLVEALRATLRRSPEPALRYVLVRASLAEGRVVVSLILRRPAALAELLTVLSAREEVALVASQVNDSPGDELLGTAPFVTLLDRGPVHERLGGRALRLRPGAFAQVNPLGAEILYALVTELAAPRGRRILDLYGGSGGIALSLAAAGAAAVLSVDDSAAATAAGEGSAREAGLQERVSFCTASADLALAQETGRDLVVLNPPRKGVPAGLVAELGRQAVPAVVYVSCGPESLARDLRLLSAQGYTLGRVVPVDLFPHTRHVETVAELRFTGCTS